MNKTGSKEQMTKKREMTILLMGQTGVGKSTFINSIVNYLSYESMDKAKSGIPICIIPVSFTITDHVTREQIQAKFGDTDDTNENTEDTTKSATQYPKCYKFENDNIVLNIIDTPGIGDTSGVEQDKLNMQNIFNFISYYREINAFCVLLKPNEAKLDVVFRYCLIQLFTHLNKSAANNIVFLFTKCRGTDYGIGETGPVLKNILKQIRGKPPNIDIQYNVNTTYCFDNEAFRYLVASGEPNNVQFKDTLNSSYNESWDRSVKECKRLFDYITQLTPHQVMDTVSVNNAKQIIQLLSKPLADIAKNNADNMKLCEKHENVIKKHKGSIDELKKQLYIPSVEIKFVQLELPKTVCGETVCCNRIRKNGVTEIIYKTVCHTTCYLEYSDGNILGDIGLTKCKAFSHFSSKDINPDVPAKPWYKKTFNKVMEFFTESYECTHCGHSYEKHIHVSGENQIVITEEVDLKVRDSIKSNESATAAVQQQCHSLRKKVAELEAENNAIAKSMSLFACFLTANALTPVNDAFVDYVQHLIENEKFGFDPADSRKTIDALERVLEEYSLEMQAFNSPKNDSEANNPKPDITAEQINKCVEDLYKLTHNGKYIREALSQLIKAKEKQHTEHKLFNYRPKPDTRFNMDQLFDAL